MATRRELVRALVSAGLIPLAPSGFAASKLEQRFDDELREALADTEAIEQARQVREGQVDYYSRFGSATRGGVPIPRTAKSARRIAERAEQMIVGYEVTSQTEYEKHLFFPYVPGGRSGVTIGIGYDLGQQDGEWLREDWRDFLSGEVLDRLAGACRKSGDRAREAALNLRDISISWNAAIKQFHLHLLPRYVGYTLQRLPKAARLSDESLGALVSLVFNRGASFHKDGDNYRQMRLIADHLEERRSWSDIPSDFRNMVWLWQEPHLSVEKAKEVRGVVTRRMVEARLFEAGLQA